jgi:hypothetical protein
MPARPPACLPALTSFCIPVVLPFIVSPQQGCSCSPISSLTYTQTPNPACLPARPPACLPVCLPLFHSVSRSSLYHHSKGAPAHPCQVSPTPKPQTLPACLPARLPARLPAFLSFCTPFLHFVNTARVPLRVRMPSVMLASTRILETRPLREVTLSGTVAATARTSGRSR